MRTFSFGDQVFQSDFFFDIFSSKIRQRSLFSKSTFTECFSIFLLFFCHMFAIFHIFGGLDNNVGKKLRIAGGSRPSAFIFYAKVVQL